MHLAQLRLRDFRNYPRVDIDFAPGFHLFLGNNGQGKTNILEAIYFLATLRSFRGVSSQQVVRHAQKGYFIGATVVASDRHDIKLYWSSKERSVTLNGKPVRRLSDFFGTFRAVVFCSEDLQLVKGPAARRRRFLDLLLAQTVPTYLPTLQRYTQTLRSRNALLKRKPVDEHSLAAFTVQLVELGNLLVKRRQALLPRFAPLALRSHKSVSREAEEFRIEYAPALKDDFASALNKTRERERIMGMTLVGPHRDDLSLLLNERPAIHFGSEGQKRTIAIALKMAQAEFLTHAHGAPPVLLIDDIMGELDAQRRSAFLPLLQQSDRMRGQVFMTATEENWPVELSRQITRWRVQSGKVAREA